MNSLLSLLLVLVGAQALAAEKLISTGEVFDPTGKEKIFSYERYQEVKGDKVFDRGVHKDLEGNVVTEEKMETTGGKFVRYEIDQKQLKQKGWIEIADGKLSFNLKKPRKRNYPIPAKLPPNFIVGFQIVPTVQANWDKLAKGEEHAIRLGVWHRQEHVGFDFSVDKEKSDAKHMVVKMAASSFIIRAIVDPLFFYFDKSSKKLTKYVGRITPKKKKGKKYFDYDGLVIYKTVK